MATPPPPSATKKAGLGCCGCGCLILALVAILFLGLVGGLGYICYSKLYALTSPTANVQSSDLGDPTYAVARQKVDDFYHNLHNHQPASIHLTANEITTLFARDPNLSKVGIHMVVAMSDDRAQLQGSYPTDLIPYHIIPARFLNCTVAFRVKFDQSQKQIMFDPIEIEAGDQVLFGAGVHGSSAAEDAQTHAFIQSMVQAFNQAFNENLAKEPDGKAILDRATTIEVQHGELVMEIQ